MLIKSSSHNMNMMASNRLLRPCSPYMLVLFRILGRGHQRLQPSHRSDTQYTVKASSFVIDKSQVTDQIQDLVAAAN
jgi:hypothetical protein